MTYGDTTNATPQREDRKIKKPNSIVRRGALALG
jgi:hypothetical protein